MKLMVILLISAALQQLVRVFRELGYTPEDCAPFSVLSQHPFIQHLMETSTHHQLVVSLRVGSSVCSHSSPLSFVSLSLCLSEHSYSATGPSG